MGRMAHAVAALALAAVVCGRVGGAVEGTPAPAEGGEVDGRRVAIYEAVIRHEVKFPDQPVAIDIRLCDDAGSPGAGGSCPGAFTSAEQEALLERLADLPSVEFVEDVETVVDRIFQGGGGQLVRLGPIIEKKGDEVWVPGSHYCGGLCGGGSVWVVEETDRGWEVTGPAPGAGVWIS